MGFGVGIGKMADGAILRNVPGGKAKGHGHIVAGLHLHFGKVDAAAIDPRGRAGLKAPEGKSKSPQTVAETDGGVHTVGAGSVVAFAGNDPAGKIGAGADNHGPGGINSPQLGHHGSNAAGFVQPNLGNHGLLEVEIFLLLQGVLHELLILPAVCLRPERMDRRALAAVEHPELDAGAVRRSAHLAAQGIDLTDQMPLAGAADGGVAGHVAHCVQIDGKDNGFQSQTGGGKGGFNAGMARTNDRNVVGLHLIFCHMVHLFACILPKTCKCDWRIFYHITMG